VPDDGFLKKAETCSTFWTIKDLSENVVVIDGPSVCLFILHNRTSQPSSAWLKGLENAKKKF
jgi:hypothetical protein